MEKNQLLELLRQKQLTDVIELIEDAEAGDLEELELVEHLGLLADEALNREVLRLLQDLGVTIIYVTDDEGDAEAE
ncbi:hypothetical protein LOK74_05580 [Brevibacillus humidisoli]|uniref:hypothetical protein n=1 Tax=Brevibacillus humidisoli TaxID=2895522 RepID=UPI001E640972|nr:hypothetical protein [Brevibacillus humidisoli]UFJ41973.1 hypothetical protein LOK74_05580 [Brevibacillus humidisoli]